MAINISFPKQLILLGWVLIFFVWPTCLQGQITGSQLEKGKQLILNGQYQEALVALASADSSLPETCFISAQAFYALAQFENASRNLDRAIDLNPVYASAYSLRGMVRLYTQHRFEDAILDFTMAISINPNDSDAYAGRAFAWLSFGNTSKALDDCRRGLRIAPAFPDLYYLRGSIYMMLDSSNATVLNEFNETLRLNPRHEDAMLNSCIVKGYMNNYEGALLDINSLISINPVLPRYYAVKANVLRNLRRLDEAMAECNLVISADSNSIEGYLTRAHIHFDRNDFKPAISDFTHCLLLMERYAGELSNNNFYQTEALYFRGLARIKLDDKARGCPDLLQAKERGDGDASIKWKEFCQ